jgi:hypothetical protein
MKAPWDKPFIWALNKEKEKPMTRIPRKGHVPGARMGHKHSSYFLEDQKIQKERKWLEELDVRDELATAKAGIPGQIQDKVENLNAILHSMVQSIASWFEGGRQGSFLLISLGSSNSLNITMLITNVPVMENPSATIAHGRTEDLSDITMPTSSPSISYMPACGPLTLAELNAITIIN